LRIAAGIYDVDTPDGIVHASLRGRLKRTDSRIASVGDLVELETVDDEMRIVRILPRQGALTRHGVSKRREQVIVANVDQVAIVAATAGPAPDLLMVDRLLALGALDDIDCIIVLNKSELVENPASALADYARLGYNILVTSVEEQTGIETLAGCLTDRITVLTGQSGVGKSSLLNALVPGLDLRVGEISERRGRGRHTTVASALYPYPDGGYVADTPGLQYLALWGVDPAGVDQGFIEIAALRPDCRFADCRHRAEPDCAVLAAVATGDIVARRHESYLRLLAEAEETR